MRSSRLFLALVLVACTAFAFGCSQSGDDSHGSDHAEASHDAKSDHGGMTEEERLNKPNPEGEYGHGLTLAANTLLTDILAEPEMFEGKKVQVKGVVGDVCPKRGCWIEVVEPQSKEMIRVKVTDGDIVFPLSAKDEVVCVEGVIERIEMTEEENRDWQEHLAEERGETFDRNSVSGPSTTWRIRGEGAEIGC